VRSIFGLVCSIAKESISRPRNASALRKTSEDPQYDECSTGCCQSDGNLSPEATSSLMSGFGRFPTDFPT